MKRILILFAHPALQRSRVNSRLIDQARNIPGVTLNDLYEEYPDLMIDVNREQELLLLHDIIVFHHPLYWYSTPSILKEWQDMVLTHGWAYGREGIMLSEKVMFNAVTTGGPEKAYTLEGSNHFTLRQLLAPLEQTATLCRMTYLPPFVVHGTHLITTETMEAHLLDYKTLLTALVEDRVDLEKAGREKKLNSDLKRILKG